MCSVNSKVKFDVAPTSSVSPATPASPPTEKKASRWAKLKTKTQDLQSAMDMANLTHDLSQRGIDTQKLKDQFPQAKNGILVKTDSPKSLSKKKSVKFIDALPAQASFVSRQASYVRRATL